MMKKYDIPYRFLYICIIISGILFLAPSLYAQQVHEAEFENLPSVTFINFEGPHHRIDTLQQIRDIGFSLGQAVRAGVNRPGALGRYFVIRSISGPEGNRLDADIFGLGPDVAVGHIRNLRLIIQGYLEGAFQYSPSDAALLAEFITIYNAVYRGDMAFFATRFKSPVMGHLTRERAGISLRYDEWPGQTLMLIPLTGLDLPLSAVDTAALADQRVVDHLRQEPDRGLEQRRDMVDLMEREAEQAEQQAAIIREEILREEQRIAEERELAWQQQEDARLEEERIAAERQQPDADQEALDERELLAQQQQQEAQDRLDELDQRQEELAQMQEEADRLDEFAEQRYADAQEGRQQIAEDQQEMIAQEPRPPQIEGLLGISIQTPSASLGHIVLLDPNTGRELARSPLNTVNVRTVIQINNRLMAVAGENRGSGAIRLVEINRNTLEMMRQGDDDIAPESLLWLNGQNLYAITAVNNNFHLARFNTELVLQNRTIINVHPFASVFFYDGFIITQRSDGSAVLLNPGDLSERR